MKRVIIDTNVYSDAMRGDSSASDIVRKAGTILMSPIVIGELLSGFRQGSREEKNREQLSEFLFSSRVESLEISAETSERFSQVVTELKLQGTPIPTNDVWLSASALEQGAWLASSDKHFALVPGLLYMSTSE